METTSESSTLPNTTTSNCELRNQQPNPRLSTTSSGAGESDQELQLNQLVVAQVHHDPILEMPSVEDKETGKISIIEHIH